MRSVRRRCYNETQCRRKGRLTEKPLLRHRRHLEWTNISSGLACLCAVSLPVRPPKANRNFSLTWLAMSLATRAESAAEPSPRRTTPPLSWRLPVAGAALARLYLPTGTFGLRFQSVHGSASPVWPPMGIALAALLLGGYALAPAVFAGAFFVNLFNPQTYGAVGVCLGIATGNTLEALAGAWLVKRYA